jgi:hypothetical protein
MTVPDFSAADQKGVGPRLKGLENVKDIHLPGAQQFYDAHIMGILEPHGSGHVGRGIGTVGAYHGQDLGIIVRHKDGSPDGDE